MARSLALVVLIALLLIGADALADRTVRLASKGSAVVRIEAGWFTMGSTPEQVEQAVQLCRDAAVGGPSCVPQSFEHETPAHRVQLASYRIDRLEVSNRAYGRCVSANVCTPSRISDLDPRLGDNDHPVAGVTWGQARRYCAWVGGSLPTEAQWESAARGGSRRPFPWGNYYNSRLSNHGLFGALPDPADGYRFAAPVAAFADGRSPHGLLNMAGNVWELTADRYAPDYYQHAERIEPRGPAEGDSRVIRGGSWRSPVHTLRVAYRDRILESDQRPDVGFRCAYNVP